MSLDRAHEILSWRPIIELDPPHLSQWEQVWRVVFMVGTKALLGGKLGREAAHERDLDEAVRRFDRADRAQPIGWWGKTGAAASAYSGKTRERGRGWSDERGEPSKAARDFRKTGRVAIPRAKQTRSDRLMTSSEVMNLEP